VTSVAEFGKRIEHLRAFIKIEQEDLDKEIVHQAQLCFDAGDLLSEINDERDAIKEELETLASEISLDLREEYDRDKIKYTEPALKAEVLVDKEYAKVNKEYRLYKAVSGRALVLQSAFETKTRMLAYLARLYVSNYYSDPTVVSTSDAVEEARGRGGRRAAAKLRKRVDDDDIPF